MHLCNLGIEQRPSSCTARAYRVGESFIPKTILCVIDGIFDWLESFIEIVATSRPRITHVILLPVRVEAGEVPERELGKVQSTAHPDARRHTKKQLDLIIVEAIVTGRSVLSKVFVGKLDDAIEKRKIVDSQ